ncbi:hypothetical protein Tco_1017884 [Tanacetum coccineum]|uniref:Uncharacterized protein n=1 Tax=Tanacetum coccineum TaxID=301880 RepID=A0ABQ5FT84_9ASTR
MITDLKNMEGWTHKYLKSKDFDSIKELFDKAFKRVNMFVDFRTDLVEGSSKRAGEELEQESTKKQKVDDDKETSELKQCLEIILMKKRRIVRIKSFLMLLGVTAALIDVNAAQSKLALLENFNENYSKCLRLLEKLQLLVQSYYY